MRVLRASWVYDRKNIIKRKKKDRKDMAMDLIGCELIDGTVEGFALDGLTELNKLYFIRTDANGDGGYIYFNRKKYGVISEINGGEY